MVAYASPPARSGRFIKGYLLGWAVAAVAALAYLVSLAWQPELATTPAAPPQRVAEPDPAIQAMSRTLAEVGAMRRSVTDMQKDIGQLKVSVDQREAQDKVVDSRLTALEDRVASITAPVAAAPSPKHKVAEQKGQPKTVVVKGPTGAEPRSPTRIISVTEETPPPPAGVVVSTPPIETGSIAQPAPVIAFGEPVVTPAKQQAAQAFGVQLGASPSLDGLKLTWGLLVEKHGATLASLQPRYIAPKAEGGPYRLLAGPLPTRAEADKVCADMGVGRNSCFSTTFVGQPL